MKRSKLKVILLVITQVLRAAIKKHGIVRRHVGTRRAVVQIKLRDDSIGRYYEISSKGVKSTAGIHHSPDVTMLFKDVDTALVFLNPKADHAEIIHAAKNFRVMILGPDDLVVWFMQLMNLNANGRLADGHHNARRLHALHH